MGLLNNLFGGKPRKTVQDERFGEMILFRPQGTASIWAGKWELLIRPSYVEDSGSIADGVFLEEADDAFGIVLQSS